MAREEGGLWCFEYAHGTRPTERVYVAWLAKGVGESARRVLPITSQAVVYRAERMPLVEGQPSAVPWKQATGGAEVEVGGAPVYLWAR
jgi:hypothetical protein